MRVKCRKAQVENVPKYYRLSDKQCDFINPVLRTEVLENLKEEAKGKEIED